MSYRNGKYYSKERENFYNSIKKRLNSDVSYTNLSFEDFVYKYFRHYTIDEFGKQTKLAPFHINIVNKLLKKDKIELAVKMSRNHAKTTVFSLFLPIYLMLRNEAHFILLVGQSKDSAVKSLINIQSELESNELLIRDFGNFVKEGNWAKGNFIVEKYNTAFYCVGKGQSTRGLRYKNYRPDVVIIDDIDTDKEVLNKVIIQKQTNWILQSVFPAMAVKKYKFIILGNQFAPDMVLTRVMEEVEGIEKLEVNAITENGEPAWKERFTIDDLLHIKKKIGSIRFEREYMNNPIIEGSVFKPEWIQWYKNGNFKFDIVITYIDPSYKKEGDFKALVTVGYSKGKYYIIDIYEKKTTMEHIFMYLFDNNRVKEDIIYIEANFAQDIHKDAYNKIAYKLNRNLKIVWDTQKKKNKITRIESLTPYFENGLIFINESLKNTNDFKQFYNEYISFPSGKNDDGIDALESAIREIDKRLSNRTQVVQGLINRQIF